jgi:hypothetical protein
MNCWEELYIQTFHQQKVLITEQQVSDTNPLFELANITFSHQYRNQSIYLPAQDTAGEDGEDLRIETCRSILSVLM